MIRAALLDLGGVLLDTGNETGLPMGKLDWRGREVLAQAVRDTGGRVRVEELEELVFAPWREEYARRYETGREARWDPHLRRLRKRTGCRARNLRLLGAWFAPYAEQLRAFPGAVATLGALRDAGIGLALVSNVALPGVLYRRVMRRLKLDPFFSDFQFSYDTGSRKPFPVMLRAALAALAVAPEDAIMVGDRLAVDIAAGRATGVRNVWVRSAHAEGPRPDFEIASIAELPALVASL